ncbi:MAG: hypothetical protein QOJ95_5036, partial [Mycobacterium sp.]|nr:hypothetical protein [Mycobacterium sp.]
MVRHHHRSVPTMADPGRRAVRPERVWD